MNTNTLTREWSEEPKFDENRTCSLYLRYSSMVQGRRELKECVLVSYAGSKVISMWVIRGREELTGMKLKVKFLSLEAFLSKVSNFYWTEGEKERGGKRERMKNNDYLLRVCQINIKAWFPSGFSPPLSHTSFSLSLSLLLVLTNISTFYERKFYLSLPTSFPGDIPCQYIAHTSYLGKEMNQERREWYSLNFELHCTVCLYQEREWERERESRYVERRPGISYYLIRLSQLSLHILFASLSLPLSKYHSLSKFTTTSNTARMRLYQWMSGSFINFSNYLSTLSFFHISFSFFQFFLFRFSPLISTQEKFFPLLSLTPPAWTFCSSPQFDRLHHHSENDSRKKMEGKAGKLWRVEGKKRRERERGRNAKSGRNKERIK